MKIKIFKLNDYEYWAAETLDEAKKDYILQTGVDAEEGFEDPYEIPEAAMKKLTIRDEDGKNEMTFKKCLDDMVNTKAKFPCCFASTEG